MQIRKRDGNLQEFDFHKVYNAVNKAFLEIRSESVKNDIVDSIHESIPNICKDGVVELEDLQDLIENILMDYEYKDVAKSYILYRANRAIKREQKTKGIFKGIISTESNEVTRENANMNSDSPAGMMMKFASESTKPFVDSELLAKDVQQAVLNNYIHIHDKDYYPTRSFTCLQHPLDKILKYGFKAGHGESRGAKRIETASILAAISMETIQNEMHGGQAIPAFDFYMAPYVKLTFKEELNKACDLIGIPIEEDYYPEEYNIDSLNGLSEKDRLIQAAINATVHRVHQSMESFVHNMNSIHSRGGKLDCFPLQ